MQNMLETRPATGSDRSSKLTAALRLLSRPLLVESGGRTVTVGDRDSGFAQLGRPLYELMAAGNAFVPPCRPSSLGDPTFNRTHRTRAAYVAGAMANGIGSVEVVEAMGRSGMLGFFGAAGLGPGPVEAAIDRISTRLGELPWGFNLIHSPYEPELERQIVDLYLRRGVHLVSASAYLDLTLPVVRYRVRNMHRDGNGRVVAPNRIVAKVSRAEVARKFLSPPPDALLRELVSAGDISAEQAQMAATIPMAEDLTVEADSGGHTDNRPALTLLPAMIALRDECAQRFLYENAPRVGAAGGISTPHSAAAAFAMGAAYVLIGSANQACLETGTSDVVRRMLAEAEQADVTMAPAADMFEMGVELQVLKRGTLFPMRARKLYNLYQAHDALENIEPTERAALEKTVFRAPLREVWDETRRFWSERDPSQVERAERDAKHRMALVFRWYLGKSSRWANTGDPTRQIDYQVWCGPAMGAFNAWARGSFLESWQNRSVVAVARNIMHGAAVLSRAQMLRSQGVALSNDQIDVAPRPLAELEDDYR